jgi:NAD(P)-dependent dehydrogenase (short-subunit alcohol dehydrogenase family)
MATVLITGCSSGFGLLTALAFARRGFHRVVATMRDPSRGTEARAGGGCRAPARQHPSARRVRPVAVTATVARAEAEHGPLDVLVNNAGIEPRSSIEDADEADIRRQFDTNVFGTVRVIQAVLPRMRERRAAPSSTCRRSPGSSAGRSAASTPTATRMRRSRRRCTTRCPRSASACC